MSNAAEAVAEGIPPTGFLALMRNRSYALLWIGQLVSELGNRFHWIAVSLWFFSLTHSATKVALAISSMHLGGLLVGLWAGVLVDRLDRKTILILSDLIRAVMVALIPTLMGLSVWLVYADLVVISMATAFFRPAMFAVIPQVVSRPNLLAANSFFSAMDTGTEIAGPALAGVLAGAFGYASLLYFDAATYTVSALCISGMIIRSAILGVAGNVNLRGIWTGVTEGLRYIRKDRLQWGLFVLIFPAYLASSGLNALITPLAKGAIGISDAQFGTFNSVWGVGFVIASLLLGWPGAKARKSTVILGGYFLMFAATALMGLSTSFQALLFTGFVVGFANTFYYVGLLTVVMEHTPQEVIGRVISTRQVALRIVNLIYPLIFGALADAIGGDKGIRQAVVAMAVLSAIGTAAMVLVYPVLRRFDRAGEPMGERTFGILSAVWRAISGPVAPTYDELQQRRLNIVAICLVIVGWLGLLYRIPRPGLWLLSVIFTIAMLGPLVGGGLSHFTRWHADGSKGSVDQRRDSGGETESTAVPDRQQAKKR